MQAKIILIEQTANTIWEFELSLRYTRIFPNLYYRAIVFFDEAEMRY